MSINEVQYSVAAQRKGPSKQSQPVEAISVEDQSQYKYFLKLANLPFRFSKEKLVGFTEGKSKPEDCYLDYERYGRPSGYAYLGLNDKSAHDSILSMHNKIEIDGRVVEVNQVSLLPKSVMHQLEHPVEANSHCVRLRGLPYMVTENEIVSFFEGCSIVEVKMCKNDKNRPIGEAVVKLSDAQSKETAIGRTKNRIGDRFDKLLINPIDVVEFRWIEVFGIDEVEYSLAAQRKVGN